LDRTQSVYDMNIDFTDKDLDWESRPHKSMWDRIFMLAVYDAINDDPNHSVERYQALDWWFKDEGLIEIDAHSPNPFVKDVDFVYARERIGALAGQDVKTWRDRVARTIMHNRMPDHITDDFPSAEDAAEDWDDILERLEPRDPDHEPENSMCACPSCINEGWAQQAKEETDA